MCAVSNVRLSLDPSSRNVVERIFFTEFYENPTRFSRFSWVTDGLADVNGVRTRRSFLILK